MPRSIAELLAQLKPDPWRTQVGFSPEVEAANNRLFDQSVADQESVEVLRGWIQKHQPCLFGRIAAKCGFLSYCVLRDADLQGRDESVSNRIQLARGNWTREGFEGKKSGFIIFAISERLAYALPDETLKELALRLCSLYLLTDVVADQAFWDEIFLEKPGPQRTTWTWHAGVNYFGAQGDERWWHDHRIPGGIAFSINSVGHMVKSGILAKAMVALESVLDAPPEGWSVSRVDSLGKALELAMRTISLASDGPSGKATELLSLPEGIHTHNVPKCPIDLPHLLVDKNYCEYLGRYHTDHTIPSAYFRPDIERPLGLPNHILDFTYLFHRALENPAFTTMGDGRRVREEETVGPAVRQEPFGSVPASRREKMVEQEVAIADNRLLMSALGRR